jgi:hypothetical protein
MGQESLCDRCHHPLLGEDPFCSLCEPGADPPVMELFGWESAAVSPNPLLEQGDVYVADLMLEGDLLGG